MNQVLVISILGAAFILLGTMLSVSIISGENIFSDFEDKVYNTFFRGKDPEATALALRGRDWYEGYSHDCRVVKKPPEYRGICAGFAITGVAIALCGVMALLFTPDAMYLAVPVVYYYLMYKPKKYRRLAEKMRQQIRGDLPRFLSLLHTELAVDIPVETAIRMISERMDTLLAQEFRDSYRDMNAGLTRWRDAILDIADRYGVETLTIFAQNIVTSYDQGLSISKAIHDISDDVNAARILEIEETAGKMTNVILLPVAFFQLMPMLIFIAFPPFLQVMNMQI